MSNSKQIMLGLSYIALAVFCYFTIFHFLDKSVLNLFDEALYAINALEMSISNDFLVLTRDFEPTLYNTKPPLVIWMQSFLMRCIGYNELAVRLPSALAALGVVIALVYFTHQILGKPIIGVISSVILLSSPGYNKIHVIKTGDLDSVLVFFMVMYSLYYIRYLIVGKRSAQRVIWMTSLFLILGYLSKSTAALIPLPALLISTIISDKRVKVLSSKTLYLAMMSILAILGVYYVYMNACLDGYLQKVMSSEYQRLYTDLMPFHRHSYRYYFDLLTRGGEYVPFIYLIPFACAFAWAGKDRMISKFCLHLMIWVAVYLIVISLVPNKLEWYQAPIFPFLSLVIGMMLYQIYEGLQTKISSMWSIMIVLTGLVVLVYNPLVNLMALHLDKHNTLYPLQEEGNAIRSITADLPDIKEYTVYMNTVYPEHKDVMKFYANAARYAQSIEIDVVEKVSLLKPGSTVLLCPQNALDSVWNKYHVKTLHKKRNCHLWQLLEKR